MAVVDYSGQEIYSSRESPTKYVDCSELLRVLEAGRSQLHYMPERQSIIFVEPIFYYNTPQGAVVTEVALADLTARAINPGGNFRYRILLQEKIVWESDNTPGNYLTLHHTFSSNSKYLNRLELYFEVGILKSSYLALVWKVLWQLGLLGIFFTGFSVLLARRIAQGIAEPILTLCERVRHADIFGPVDSEPLHTNNELEELATEFDRRNRRLQEEIAERKEAEESVIKASLEWSAAMDASDDALYLLDTKRHILRANKVFYQITGSTPETAIGQYIEKIVHPNGEDAPCPVCLAQQELRDEIITMEPDHPDNPSGKPIEVNVKVVRGETGKPISIFMRLHDLTERRQKEEEKRSLESQLRQSQKMEAIGTLAGGIAHDFNNILSPIIGYTEMVSWRMPEKSEEKTFLDEVLHAADRAKGLVQQILTFSRQTEQARKPFQIHLVIKEAIKLLRSSIPATIEIREDIDNTCGAVLADPTQIHQLIMNLGTNAYHAMKETGGVLGIALHEIELRPEGLVAELLLAPGSYVRLDVSDTGQGIPKEVVGKIFDPYFTTKKQNEGTGLGLAIVHGIVKSYNGKVTVYSEPGVGTTFHIYLPCLRRNSDIVEIKKAKKLPVGNERILVVDDEESIVNMEKMMLISLGYQVDSASNGKDALLLLQNKSENYDLLVTDMTMPGMNGIELSRQAWEIRKGLPVIICTGFSQTLNGEKAKAMGVSKYLTKPLSQVDLAEAVREALDQRGSVQD
jgi:PAS domain S-box-containing protein